MLYLHLDYLFPFINGQLYVMYTHHLFFTSSLFFYVIIEAKPLVSFYMELDGSMLAFAHVMVFFLKL